MITYANYLQANGQAAKVTTNLWPILKLDLDYVAQYWNQTGFDLWEEVNGSSFFTTAVQHRALRQGAAIAIVQGDTTRASTYTTQAANVLCFLQVCEYSRFNNTYLTQNAIELLVFSFSFRDFQCKRKQWKIWTGRQ